MDVMVEFSLNSGQLHEMIWTFRYDVCSLATLQAATTLGTRWLKFLYWQLDSQNSYQIANHRKLILEENYENNNLLSELYWNDKVLSADMPEGKDEKMSLIFIKTNA